MYSSSTDSPSLKTADINTNESVALEMSSEKHHHQPIIVDLSTDLLQFNYQHCEKTMIRYMSKTILHFFEVLLNSIKEKWYEEGFFARLGPSVQDRFKKSVSRIEHYSVKSVAKMGNDIQGHLKHEYEHFQLERTLCCFVVCEIAARRYTSSRNNKGRDARIQFRMENEHVNQFLHSCVSNAAVVFSKNIDTIINADIPFESSRIRDRILSDAVKAAILDFSSIHANRSEKEQITAMSSTSSASPPPCVLTTCLEDDMKKTGDNNTILPKEDDKNNRLLTEQDTQKLEKTLRSLGSVSTGGVGLAAAGHLHQQQPVETDYNNSNTGSNNNIGSNKPIMHNNINNVGNNTAAGTIIDNNMIDDPRRHVVAVENDNSISQLLNGDNHTAHHAESNDEMYMNNNNNDTINNNVAVEEQQENNKNNNKPTYETGDFDPFADFLHHNNHNDGGNIESFNNNQHQPHNSNPSVGAEQHIHSMPPHARMPSNITSTGNGVDDNNNVANNNITVEDSDLW